MPCSSSCFSLKSLFISRIEKCFPRKWKQDIQQTGIIQNQWCKSDSLRSKSRASESGDKLMIARLVTSLNEYSSQGLLHKAFAVFSSIQHCISSSSCHGFILEPISSLLLACANLKSLPPGRQLHAQIVILGLDQHPLLIPKLVTLYSALNLLFDAHVIAKNSRIVHPLPWNVLISVYVRNGLYTEALSSYKQMLNRGIRADAFTYPSVLKACGEQNDIDFGREVHRSINASDYEGCLYVQNALVSMYGKCGAVEIARELFDKMYEKDAVSWNSMISSYASKGLWEEAFELFEDMRAESVELNIITWNTIAGGCLQTRNYNGALGLLCQMRSCGICLDTVAVIIGLTACSHIGILKPGKEIHASAIRSGCDEYANVQNALITMYSRSEDLRHALIVFRQMEAKDIISWNSIISGYARWEKSEEAAFLFRKMLLSGVQPNYVSIASILPLCARTANLHHGKEFHCYITRHHEFSEYLLLWNALIDMYSRSGKISAAKRVFDALSKKDEVTYTSLIAGFGIQGQGEVALKLFEELINSDVKPDHITMVAVLSACSHSGLITQGQFLFERMLTVYGISPRLEHFACMVDLFGRAGLLKKAEQVMRMMPYPPSAAMWATLIGACSIHRNMEIGEWAADKLLEMRPENSGYYILIANMYAAAGVWNKLAEVRTFMRDLGVRKDPGYAWLDIGTGFEQFSVGYASMVLSDEIYPLLEGLSAQLKDAGYVSMEDYVADAEAYEE